MSSVAGAAESVYRKVDSQNGTSNITPLIKEVLKELRDKKKNIIDEIADVDARHQRRKADLEQERSVIQSKIDELKDSTEEE
jgi:hypothetical protein